MYFFRPVIIPALLFTIAGVGCSSNDPNDEVLIDDFPAGSPSDNPYQDPDPDGMTVIARTGYAKVHDRANALVSGSYLDGLLSVEDYINTTFVLFEEFENRQFDCPETGNVLITQSGFAGPRSTMQFANCGINGVELNGPLVHVRGGGAIGGGRT